MHISIAQLWARRSHIKSDLTVRIYRRIYSCISPLSLLKRTAPNHTFIPSSSLTSQLPKMAAGYPTFTIVASIPKLKGKANYEEWRNAVQGFCEVNGLWRYMLGQIIEPKAPSPPQGKELDEKTKEAYDTKLLQWLTVTDSLRKVIRSTCTLDPLSLVNNLDLCADIWTKFEHLYRDTGFMERDTILIRLSSKTASDFEDVAHFAASLKRDSTRLKEIGITDVPDWMFTTWLLQGLTSEYDSFRMMLNYNRKAAQAKGKKTEPDFDSILEQILNLDTQKKTSEARSMKSALKPKCWITLSFRQGSCV